MTTLTNGAQCTTEEGEYPFTERNQLEAFFYIKMAFRKNHPQINMPELASTILEMAEYWLVTKTQRSERMAVTQYVDEKSVYLRSPRIVGRAYQPVRKIVFQTKSHDQGWSDVSREHGGTYNASWSWFEVARDFALSSLPPHTAEKIVTFDERICNNVHASKDPKVHTVCWPAAAAGPEESERYQRYHWAQARNEEVIDEWVKQLRPGDRVCLIPRALYPGWSNTVYSAEIKIFTSFLRPM